MARRRRRKKTAGAEFLDDAVDALMDSAFDHVGGLVDRVKDGQRPILHEKYLRQMSFTCIVCKKDLRRAEMEMFHDSNGWGICKGCLRAMWIAYREKVQAFAVRTQQQAHARPQQTPPRQGVHVGAATPPAGPPPWEILGVSQDATIDEIKKAYREKAMLWHPDRVASDAPAGERDRARTMFDTVTKARDVMLSVRQSPTA
jgi:hypothetical protein